MAILSVGENQKIGWVMSYNNKRGVKRRVYTSEGNKSEGLLQNNLTWRCSFRDNSLSLWALYSAHPIRYDTTFAATCHYVNHRRISTRSSYLPLPRVCPCVVPRTNKRWALLTTNPYGHSTYLHILKKNYPISLVSSRLSVCLSANGPPLSKQKVLKASYRRKRVSNVLDTAIFH